jgi:hypothetical protein
MITNGYCTADQLREWMGIQDSADEPLLEAAIESASRAIDVYCDRRFYTDDTATARVYHPRDSYLVDTDDFYTTTGLVVASGTTGSYGTTWSSTYYQLEPLNGLGAGGLSVPYFRIRAVGGWFPSSHDGRPTLQITAKWGWAAVPDAVYNACLLMAARLFRRRNTPEGFAAGESFGAIRVSSKVDPDAAMLLNPYRKVTGTGLVVA